MNQINFKKKFGQNFLTDKNLLKSIVSDSGIGRDDVVLEIGAGAGALTEFLLVAKKVVSFEIDKQLMPILDEKFAGKDNLEIIYEDFLNFDEQILLEKLGDDFKVVANLPYYITTPILTKLFSLKVRPKTICVMVQKEVGQRIVAGKDDENYGYFSAFVRANANAKIVRQVGRKMFMPVPNVDSCIVLLTLKDNNYEPKFFDFMKVAFSMKRKTLINNVCKQFSLSKDEVLGVLKSLNFDPLVRADNLNTDEMYCIYKQLNL